MGAWSDFGNNSEANCCIAACANAITLWTGTQPSQDAVERASNRFGGLDSYSKPLWGWLFRGIGGHRLGGFARIQPSEIGDAVARFGCAYVGLKTFKGIERHCVLQIPKAVVSWGKEYPAFEAWDVAEANAIAPKWHPILAWWAVKNNRKWWLLALPVLPLLWWAL